jgi:hypothetical protein
MREEKRRRLFIDFLDVSHCQCHVMIVPRLIKIGQLQDLITNLIS